MANNTMININHRKLSNAIRRHYMSDEPLMIWGAPGIGKSQVVQAEAAQLAKNLEREFIDWNSASPEIRKELATADNNAQYFIYGDCRLSQYDPSDWALPWKAQDSDDMVWIPSQLLRAYSRPGTAGILFLDELPQAMPAVQSASYQIILDRCYKDISFKNIRIIAAGNRASDGGAQYPLSPALASRINHVELDSPYGKDWVKDWAREAGIHPLICAFITTRPEMLYEETGKTENRRTAFQCPRAWARCSNVLKTLGEYTSGRQDWWIEEAFDIVAASVGRGAALEFQAYLTVLHDVFLEDFLENPAKIKDVGADIQLGIQAMLEGHMKNVYRSDKLTAEEKAEILTKALDLADQKMRAEIRGMMLAGVIRAAKGADGSAGITNIQKLLTQAKNRTLQTRLNKAVSEVMSKLTGQKVTI